MQFETIVYRTEGPIARLTLNRPRIANAQSIQMIDEIAEALVRAERNDEVRVLVLDAEGRNFCAGHDLKEIFDGHNPGLVERRMTTEGRVLLEEEYYWDKCLNLRAFPKPTVGVVQGHCLAAGFMLVAMCDLIVASEDAQFGNPVLRMAGACVEILAEPWEVGIRKAKEMLLTGDSISAAEAHRLGMVNRVVTRDDLTDEALRLAGRIALMPPFTTRLVKKSLNKTQDLMGYQDALDYAFMVHQVGHTTAEWDEMHDRHLREGKTFKEFLQWRDEHFAQQEA